MSKRKRYSPEYKREIVELVRRSGSSCRQVALEVGQLLFIAAVLSLVFLGARVRLKLPRWSRRVPPYLVGTVAMFWVMQRVAAF